MAEKKYAKYFITSDKPDLKLPEYRHDYDFIKRVTHIDADTVPGAKFYNESMWITPTDTSKGEKVLADSHTHSWGQFLCFYVYDYDDIHNLGAEIEFTIDGEKHVITESFSAFIPAPIFVFSSGSTEKYE